MKKIAAGILVLTENSPEYETILPVLTEKFRSVRFCQSPEELYDLLTNGTFEIVLLDMDFHKAALNGAEGIYWIRRIRSIDPACRVIPLMDPQHSALVAECISAGAADPLMKPWSEEALIARISQALTVPAGSHVRKLPPGSMETFGKTGSEPATSLEDPGSSGKTTPDTENKPPEKKDSPRPGGTPAKPGKPRYLEKLSGMPSDGELEEMEMLFIGNAWKKFERNLRETAKYLGMSERDLYFKLEKYNL